MFYPNHLALFYPHMGYKLPIWQAVISLLALVGVSVFLVYTVRRRRYPAVGWLWFLGTLLPVVGLLQVGSQAIADRYTYLPSIGFFIVVVWGAAELFRKWRFPKIGVGVLAAVVLGVLLLCTRTQVRYWKNSVTLYEHALEVTEDNFAMHRNLANTFEVRGKLDEAIYHYQEALRIKPNDSRPHASLGDVLQSQGKFDEAINHYRHALRIKPNDARPHASLGDVFQSQGSLDKAVSHYLQALRIKPDFAEVHSNLGVAMLEQGQLDGAFSHFRQAVSNKPDFVDALNNLAWLMATHPEKEFHNPAEAVRLAETACELTDYQNPGFLDTLAAAYAAVGRFADAAATAEKAVRIIALGDKKDGAGQIQNRLDLYRQQKPYRQPSYTPKRME
jgi:tetratricopeptide (TPR) repeat protein